MNEAIFPTFFLSGFECSTFLWKEQGRRDLVAETRHDAHVLDDYAFLRSLGIAVAREGAPWPLMDQGGVLDLSRLDPFIEALNRNKIMPIWDLCHYGYPEDLNPFEPAFPDRLAAFAQGVAEYVLARVEAPSFFTPVNEITFFGYMGGEWGWTAPWGRDLATRERLRLALCAADIAAVRAIREVDSRTRMVHVDPLVNVVAPLDRPDLEAAARYERDVDTYYAWDVLAGLRHPELGGAPDVLDIVGVNCYSFGQMEYREHGPNAALQPGDPRIVPLCELLTFVSDRYRRPMIIAETSGLKDGREDWLRDVVDEAMAAVLRGVDMQGLCLFPAVDMPDWHTGQWLHNGLCDLLETADGDLRRVPAEAYIDQLRAWQRITQRVTELDEDPFDEPVNLSDIRRAAERLHPQPDADWS